MKDNIWVQITKALCIADIVLWIAAILCFVSDNAIYTAFSVDIAKQALSLAFAAFAVTVLTTAYTIITLIILLYKAQDNSFIYVFIYGALPSAICVGIFLFFFI